MRCDLRPIYFLWASVPRLSFSVPPNGGSVVSTVTRKAWVRADGVSTQTKAYLEPSLRGRGPIESRGQSRPSWELWWMAPGSSLGSCLGCCSEQKGHVVTALANSLCFKGNPAFLAIYHPIRALLLWPLFLCTQSAVSTQGSVLGAHT